MLVAAEDVEHGKPAPDCFRLAAARLGTTAERCLVIEDSPAGIAAAERAGARVLVITATHSVHLQARHPAILDFRDLVLVPARGGSLWIRQAGGNPGPQASISWLLDAGGR
jgi:sugar-phosphatase